MKKQYKLLFLFFFPLLLHAQEKAIVLINGTIHTGTGKVITNGILVMQNGKISAVGDVATVKYDGTKSEVIDVAGKQVYPGMIALNSQLGLKEIDLARSTNDVYEVGGFHPEIRSIIAYNTDSKVIPTIRTNGILLAQITPFGGVVHGTSSIVKLNGWNWEDAAYKTDDAVHMSWPSVYSYDFKSGQLKINGDYRNQVDDIREFFSQAKAYCAEKNHDVKNLKFEALRNVFDGKKKVFIEAIRAKEIIGAVEFANDLGIKMVLLGGNESYEVLDLLKQNNIPVVLERVHALPVKEGDDIEMPYKLPGILSKAGILVGISLSNGSDGYWNVRNLPFEAGTAAAYGMGKEDALATVTLNNAKILGIDQTAGSLEPGKDALVIVSDGDLLDMRTSTLEYIFINGERVDVKNWQYDNYVKYSKKYGIEIK